MTIYIQVSELFGRNCCASYIIISLHPYWMDRLRVWQAVALPDCSWLIIGLSIYVAFITHISLQLSSSTHPPTHPQLLPSLPPSLAPSSQSLFPKSAFLSFVQLFLSVDLVCHRSIDHFLLPECQNMISEGPWAWASWPLPNIVATALQMFQRDDTRRTYGISKSDCENHAWRPICELIVTESSSVRPGERKNAIFDFEVNVIARWFVIGKKSDAADYLRTMQDLVTLLHECFKMIPWGWCATSPVACDYVREYHWYVSVNVATF